VSIITFAFNISLKVINQALAGGIICFYNPDQCGCGKSGKISKKKQKPTPVILPIIKNPANI